MIYLSLKKLIENRSNYWIIRITVKDQDIDDLEICESIK